MVIKVRESKVPQLSLSASPLSIAHGGSTTISWSSKNVNGCTADGDWSGQKQPFGSLDFEGLTADSEFRLICAGEAGEVVSSVSVNVYEAGIEVPQVDLSAKPERIPYNGSILLSWSSENADICRAWGDWFGSKARSGSQTITQLNSDSRFILACTIAGGGGGEGVDAVEVKVEPAPPPTVTLSASPSKVKQNGSTTLRWSSSYADRCIGTGDWSGTKRVSGSQTVGGLKKNSIFSLKCIGIGGLGSDSVTIELTDERG